VGRTAIIEKLRRDPLARALRMGRLPLVALEATVTHLMRGEIDAVPAMRALRMPLADVRARAEGWARRLTEAGVACEVVALDAVAGGGAFAEESVPSAGVALEGDAEAWLAALRTGDLPVVARIAGDRVVLDARSVLPDEDDALVTSVVSAHAPSRSSPPT
jgi:L-seryl-tRNA(Ser) seleniumtransferase